MVYPNPSSGTININLERTGEIFDQLRVFDLHGKLIQSIVPSNNREVLFIDTPGVYILRFENEDVNTIKRIIIQ